MKNNSIFILALIIISFLTIKTNIYARSIQEMEFKEIYPGVWKATLGVPEDITPTKFAYKAPKADALKTFEFKGEIPKISSTFDFSANKRGSRIIASMSNTEKIYGLGLNTKIFDKTDKRCIIRPTDHPETEENGSHAPNPFFVSTEGYGIYLDTARYATMYFGCTSPLYIKEETSSDSNDDIASNTDDLYKTKSIDFKTMLIDIPVAQGVDVYLFAGKDITEVVKRYNLFSGGGTVPPLWGLGVQYRGDAGYSAEEHEKLAKSFREDKIPCDMWGLEPGWQTKTYSCSFVWNDKLYPNPTKFAKDMKDMGLHMNVWQHCFTHPTSPIYEKIYPYSGDFKVWQGAVPDFMTKEANKIFSDHQKEILYSKDGIDGVKLDECDHQPEGTAYWSFPESTEFPSGADGEQMHSLIGYLYQKVMVKPLDDMNKRTWGLVRNSHGLAAPLPYTVYSDSYSQDCYLRGLVSTGFSGSLWVPEVRDASSIEDFYRRTQICLLSPLMIVNSWYLKLPPWKQIATAPNRELILMDNHEEVTNNIRDMFNLRMSLIPYIYTSFMNYHTNGTPPFRALVMDSSADPATYQIDDQFLLGENLMVAPCLTGKSTRKIYFPKDTDWIDFYTGEKFIGGTTAEITIPVEKLPIYVKNNTILPIAKPVQNVADNTVFDITCNIYGDNPKDFILYEDDGVSYDFESEKQNQIKLSYKDNKGQTNKTGSYKGKRFNITDWVKK